MRLSCVRQRVYEAVYWERALGRLPATQGKSALKGNIITGYKPDAIAMKATIAKVTLRPNPRLHGPETRIISPST